VERQGHLRPGDGGFGRQSRRRKARKDGHDRRDLSEGASHGDRFGRRKGGAVARPTQGRHERQVARHSADSRGRSPGPFVTAVEVGDCIGARALPSSLPQIAWSLGDRGYIAALTPTGSERRRKTKGDVPASPCIPLHPRSETARKARRIAKRRDKRRNRHLLDLKRNGS